MIVALLVLIVLILLFGAGVVKGWIANAVTLGCGGLAIMAALLWLGSFFGENGVQYVLWTVIGIMLLLALVGMALDPNKPAATHSRPARVKPAPNYEAPVPKPPSPQQQSARDKSRDKVWSWYAADIVHRFNPEAQAKARELYGKSDALGLDRLCREELARLGK